MQYRQIEAFRFVMVTGTTIGAASSMCITQPAVSRLISDLEHRLKFKLFDRFKGRLVPTAEAIRFYQGVDQFYMGFDQLERIADQIRTLQPSDLKISATPALATNLFPEAVRQFKIDHPNVDIQLECFSSSEIIERIQTHLTHLAITSAFPEIPGVVQQTLVSADHVCAMHSSHPLAAKDLITPQDLQGEQVLNILPSGLVNWTRIKKVLKQAGVDCRSGLGVQNSHTGYSLVAANLAVALIEPFAAPTWKNNHVITKPFSPAISFDYVVAYSSTQQQTEQQTAFIDILQKIT